VYWQAIYYDNSIFSSPQLAAAVNGSYGFNSAGNPVFPSASWTLVEKDAASVGVPTNTLGGLGWINGYGSADMLVDALKAFQATGKPLTTENLTNFINAGWTYPGLGNVLPPAAYPSGHYIPTPCGSLIQIDATAQKIVPISDLHCVVPTM
jgi:hypothetical protein